MGPRLSWEYSLGLDWGVNWENVQMEGTKVRMKAAI